MGINRAGALRCGLVVLLVCIACFSMGTSFAAAPHMSAAQLRAKYTELASQLRKNPFQRPLHLESAESAHGLQGEIYAVVNYPFATVNLALNSPEHWCDVLILHLNVKYCHASGPTAATTLSVDLGRKYYQQRADAYRIEFHYRGVTTLQDYFALELNAESGPLGTHDYRIWIEATPVKDGRTFLHVTYAYAFSWDGRLAMQGYLATLGRDKVGFTVTGRQPDGTPAYVQGVRAVVERNTMRYYLAIDAYLAALDTPPKDQLEKRIRYWYDATERYARQLHEVSRDDYLKMKRREYRRQQ